MVDRTIEPLTLLAKQSNRLVCESDDKSANKGPPRGREMLGNSLRTYGAGRAVLGRPTGIARQKIAPPYRKASRALRQSDAIPHRQRRHWPRTPLWLRDFAMRCRENWPALLGDGT